MGWRNAPWNAILTVVGRLGPRGLIVIGEWSRLEPITFFIFNDYLIILEHAGSQGGAIDFDPPITPARWALEVKNAPEEGTRRKRAPTPRAPRRGVNGAIGGSAQVHAGSGDKSGGDSARVGP